MPLADAFAEFEEEAFAAASIGQVHRATTTDGSAVAVKIQYPGIAEAVETDLRNMQMLFPLVKRLAPGLDVKALAQRAARAHRRRARLRGRGPEPPRDGARLARPPVRVRPAGRHAAQPPPRARHRAASTAAASRQSSGSRTAERDRFGEIVFRFFFGTLKHLRRAAGDPHPGNYLLLDDGRVGFLDFGLMRVVDADYLEGERAARPGRRPRGDAQAVHAASPRSATCPSPDTFDPERLLAQIQTAGEWYLEPGFRRLDARLRDRPDRRAARARARTSSSRCAARRSRRRRC